ncbi:MAG TPA: VOC family protein [Gemmatimonadales bacterium]|nr:VOC family protein [Gemmatimonadales bacterium]
MFDSQARLPDDITLGPVRLQVASLARSLAYYQDVLGLRPLSRTATSATLGAQGGEEPLVEVVERSGAAPVPRRGRLGLYHFAILLPDRAALGRFVEHLARIGARAGASNHLVSEALYLTDPDGLGIEVYADRPRSEWRWSDGELQMSTEPLDLEAVAAAGAGEPWTGMPRGTRVGHLHLHVGAIDRAAGFYGEALGLTPTVRSYPGALFLSAGGYHHHLGVNTWAGEAAAPGPGDARLLEWTIVTPDRGAAAAAAERVARAGYAADESSGGWLLTDPWGTQLRLRGAR